MLFAKHAVPLHIIMIRFTDLLFASILLVIFLPFMLLIALLVKVSTKGPVIFSQQRIGINGRSFSLFKFRTMKQGKTGSRITIGKDDRITAIGHFLRRFKLDELPQLWNVIKGDMSLVGPRPEVSFYVDQYTSWQKNLLSVAPGITDLSSLILSNEADLLAKAPDPQKFYTQTLLKQKLRLSAIYASRPTISLYFLLLWWTALTLLHLPLTRVTRIRNLLGSSFHPEQN
jgi:lipopolysaccharide/colanic/teichoic acid biosynthesis glycosyltransferase